MITWVPVYWIFIKLDRMIPLWKGKNPIYFGVDYSVEGDLANANSVQTVLYFFLLMLYKTSTCKIFWLCAVGFFSYSVYLGCLVLLLCLEYIWKFPPANLFLFFIELVTSGLLWRHRWMRFYTKFINRTLEFEGGGLKSLKIGSLEK
jgi:hypothetical protein